MVEAGTPEGLSVQQQQQQQHNSRPSRGVLCPPRQRGGELECSHQEVSLHVCLPYCSLPLVAFGVRMQCASISCSRFFVVMRTQRCFSACSAFVVRVMGLGAGPLVSVSVHDRGLIFVFVSVLLMFFQRFDPRCHLWRLLLLGGDVEPNPGPLFCGVCGKRCGGRGPKCGGCCGWMHLGCSGLRRAEFYCLEGREEPGFRGRCCTGVVAEGGGRGGSQECAVCGTPLRGDGVACEGCDVRVHGSCTGLTGWMRRRLRTNGWRCGGCDGPREERIGPGGARGAIVRPLGGGRCGVCRSGLRSGQRGVSCVACGMVVHQKCCGLSRWARERGEEWRCSGCAAGDGADEERRALVNEDAVEPGRVDEVVPSAVETAVDAAVDVNGGRCGVCRAAMRRGHGGMRCCECGLIAHKQCCGLSR